MRPVLASVVFALFMPTAASHHPLKPKCPPKPPAPAPGPTQASVPRWEVVDAAGTTVGVAGSFARDGVATVLLAVGTETAAVNVSGSGWTSEGGGPLYYLAPDCTGDAFTPRHFARSLTAHAFGAYIPEEGLNDTNLYIADVSVAAQDLVVYSMRTRTADDTCINTGATAPTTLQPVQVFSTAMAGYRLPFTVRTVR